MQVLRTAIDSSELRTAFALELGIDAQGARNQSQETRPEMRWFRLRKLALVTGSRLPLA